MVIEAVRTATCIFGIFALQTYQGFGINSTLNTEGVCSRG